MTFLLSVTTTFAMERPVGQSNAATVKERPSALRQSGQASTTQVVRKQEARERMQTKRTEAQARVADKREKAIQRMSDIKDKVKKQLAERLVGQFDTLNKTWTDHFMNLLDRYGGIVQKIQDRANSAGANGADISTISANIQSAQTAIASAQSAVTAQAEKTYTLDITALDATISTTTPSGQAELIRKLRSSFQTLHKGLFDDLFALRNGPVTDARKAVQSAIQSLGNISGHNEPRNASSSTPSSY